MVTSLQKEVPNAYIISNNYIPNKACWDLAVNRALQMINRNKSPLIKVITLFLPWLFCSHLHDESFCTIISSCLIFLCSYECLCFPCINFVLKIQIVLARCSRVVTSTDINPLAWLACLQVFTYLSSLF